MNVCPPDVFVQLIVLTGSAPRPPLTVPGRAIFEGLRIGRPIEFRGITFTGTFAAKHSNFEGSVGFVDCHFERGVDLEGTKIEGSLTFVRCTFGTPAHVSTADAGISLKLDHAVVEGDLEFDVRHAAGALCGRGMSVTGDLRFRRAGLATEKGMVDERGPDGPSVALNLTNAKVGGSLSLSARREEIASAQEVFKGSDDAADSQFGGSVVVDGLSLKGDLVSWVATTIIRGHFD